MCCPVPNRRAMPQWLAAPRTHHYPDPGELAADRWNETHGGRR
jgi:hypothetical protein